MGFQSSQTQKLIQINSKILRTVSVCFVNRRQTVHELQWPSGQCQRRSSSKVRALCLKNQQGRTKIRPTNAKRNYKGGV